MQPFDIASGTNVLLGAQPPDRFATQVEALLLIKSLLDFLQTLADPTKLGLRFTRQLILNDFG
jgi:hypothetical protein